MAVKAVHFSSRITVGSRPYLRCVRGKFIHRLNVDLTSAYLELIRVRRLGFGRSCVEVRSGK